MPWTHDFNPRSRKGNDEYYCDVMDEKDISIHVPNAGNDDFFIYVLNLNNLISIHVPYTGNDRMHLTRKERGIISIHVPYTGNDDNNDPIIKRYHISIHVPYTGNDRLYGLILNTVILFQSTFPIQGTTTTVSIIFTLRNISIHVPYTGND